MGVQDRDYWRERYDELHGRVKKRRVSFSLPSIRVGIPQLITWSCVALVVAGLGSMAYRFLR